MIEQLLHPFRRKMGRSFRKSLGVFNYKVGKRSDHKKPGMIPFHEKQQLLKILQIRLEKRKEIVKDYLVNLQNVPYLCLDGFRFDEKKVPYFNIPSLEHFKLRPYVSVHTPPISEETRELVRKLNDFTLEENFNRYVNESKTIEDQSNKELSNKE